MAGTLSETATKIREELYSVLSPSLRQYVEIKDGAEGSVTVSFSDAKPTDYSVFKDDMVLLHRAFLTFLDEKNAAVQEELYSQKGWLEWAQSFNGEAREYTFAESQTDIITQFVEDLRENEQGKYASLAGTQAILTNRNLEDELKEGEKLSGDMIKASVTGALKEFLQKFYEGNEVKVAEVLKLLNNVPVQLKLDTEVKMEGASTEKCEAMLKELLELAHACADSKSKTKDSGMTNLEDTTKVESVQDSTMSWQEKLGFTNKGTVNVNVGTIEVGSRNSNTTMTTHGGGGGPEGGPKKESSVSDDKDAKKAKEAAPVEDPHLGKKVDHAHKMITQRVEDEKDSVAQKVRLEAEENLKAATKAAEKAKSAFLKAQAKQKHYATGLDSSKVGVFSLLAGGVAFLALAFISLPVAAAVAAVAAIGTAGWQVVSHKENKAAANLECDNAKKALDKALAEKGKAEKAATKDSIESRTANEKMHVTKLEEKRAMQEGKLQMSAV